MPEASNLSPTGKAFQLIFELWSGECTLEYAQRALGADCVRTVLRHIDQINRATSDIVIERHGDRVRLARTKKTLDLFGGVYDERAVAAIASTPLGGLIKRKGELPDRILNRVRPLLDVGQGASENSELVLIFEALLSGRFFRYTYTSEGHAREHRGVAVRLYLDPVQPYLVAWDEAKRHLICLATTKISSIRGDGTERMAPDTFEELGNYCRQAWGKMIRHDMKAISKAEFLAHPAVASYFLKHPLHLRQRTEALPEGSLMVALDIHNPKEFVRYMLRFGEGVTILGDASVLEELRTYLGEMSVKYSKGSGSDESHPE